MEKFKVDFYKKEDGTKPVGQFIRSLDIKMKAKVVANMHLLEEYGNIIATNGFVKKQQKTPRSEIELAKDRRSDYHRRKEAGTYE